MLKRLFMESIVALLLLVALGLLWSVFRGHASSLDNIELIPSAPFQDSATREIKAHLDRLPFPERVRVGPARANV